MLPPFFRSIALVCVLMMIFLLTANGCTSGRTIGTFLPVSRSEGSVVQRMVGNGIQMSEYTGAGEGPVDSGDQLRCSFDQSCCWRSGPSSQVLWMKTSGNPESGKMKSSFDSSDNPNGGFLIASSEGARSESDKAQFISCKISCTASDITLRARHWASRGVSLAACTVDADTNERKTCKTWSENSGVPDTVTLPGGENTAILIEATGFTTPTGSVVMLDDIIADFQTCSGSTLAPTPPSTVPPVPTERIVPVARQRTPAASVSGACSKVVCNFEKGNFCSYADAKSGGSGVSGASVPWKVVNGPFENKLTGIKKAAEGGKFAGAYLKPGDKAALVTNVNYPNGYVVRLNGYRATEGINLFGCCNDITQCPFSTTNEVQVSDYRKWKSASLRCPSGSKKVIFYAENSGHNQGAVGLDNVQLLAPSSSPDAASKSAC